MSNASHENWLAEEVAAGRVDTVALSFADRLGAWRGKRVPAKDFIEHGTTVLGFCDGMIVCDIGCGVIEQTPFSNSSTGYPDLHVTFDSDDARPMGWRPREAFVFGVPSDHEGIALAVAPIAVLASVIHRLGEHGIEVSVSAELSGAFCDRERRPVRALAVDDLRNLPRLLADALVASWIPVHYCMTGFDHGSFAVGFDSVPPLELAQAVVVAKGAAKELARDHDLDAVFMTRRPGAAQPALLSVNVTLEPSPSIDLTHFSGLLAESRPLLFPSVSAMRQADVAPVQASSSAAASWIVSASAEADPATALATILAGMGAVMDGVLPGGSRVDDLARCATLLESDWLCQWLGEPFLENSVPLFQHEASLFASAVTDWEIERYWRNS